MSFDAYFDDVSLLLHGDGADNGTVFTDNSPSPKTVTAYGNAKTSTAQSKFGGSSIFFDGNGDYLVSPSNSAFQFGTGDFTIEAWVYIPTGISGSYAAICDIRSNPQGNGAVLFKLNSSRQLGYYGATETNTTATVPLSTWTHVAISRSSGTTRLFISGDLSATVADGDNKSINGCYIGRVYDNANPAFSGYIDDLRITKGVGRYVSSFTPPSGPHPDSVSSLLEVIASVKSPLGDPAVLSNNVYLVQAKSDSPLGAASVFLASGNVAFIAIDSPLGTVSALSVVPLACRIASSGPLGVPATLARYSISARVSAASPLGIAQPLAFHDFTGQIGDTATRYVMDLITPSGTVRVPISSWQATLRTGASSYVQCVIPAAQPWRATINAATSFRVYRRAVTTGGQVFEYLMAEAPADTQQFDRGPTNPTCTLSGYAPGFAGQDVSPGTDRTLTGIRSISSGASYRVRCAVDWLLRPGQRGVVDGVPFVVEWINYYVNTADAYMEVGT